jgi:hypothetical protein
MLVEIWVWILALVTCGIATVIGLFVLVWLWRNAQANRWERLSIVAATTALACGGFVNSLFALLRLRSDWFSP